MKKRGKREREVQFQDNKDQILGLLFHQSHTGKQNFLGTSAYTCIAAAVPYIDSSAVEALKDLHQEYKLHEVQVGIL